MRSNTSAKATQAASANTAMRYGRVKSALALGSLLDLSLDVDAGCTYSDAKGADGMAVA
jgi:hypothetical protein